jgi:hypothetical protein
MPAIGRFRKNPRAVRAPTRLGRLLLHADHGRRAEINGLMTYDRKPKAESEVLRKTLAQ